MELISDYLETYEGRDKFLRTLSYASKLLSIIPKSNENAEKIKYFSSQMSGCRVMLRLLDDIPTIYYTYSYGWGKQVSLNIIKLFLKIKKSNCNFWIDNNLINFSFPTGARLVIEVAGLYRKYH